MNMRTLVLVSLSTISACSACLLPWLKNQMNQLQTRPRRNDPAVSSVCVYSEDPERFQPKCFLCPDDAYPNIMDACTNATGMPSNLTFTQASCVERNCMINYPQDQRSELAREEQRSKRETQSGTAESGVVSPSTGDPQSDLELKATDEDEMVMIGGKKYFVTRHVMAVAYEEKD